MRQVERDKLGEQLSAYLDGELDEACAAEVEALIEQSDEARQLLDELRAVADHVANLPRVRAPDSLGGKVRQHAEREILAGKRRHQRGGRIIRLLGTITASAAVLAACLLVGYQTLRWDTGSGTLSSTEKTGQSYVMRDATTVDEYVAARKVEPAPPRVAIGGKSRSPAEAADRAIRTETPRARASEIDAAESEKLAWANAGEQSRDESEPSIAAAPELAEDLLLAEVGPPTSAVGDEVQVRTPDVDVVIAAQSSEQYARAVAAVQEWQAGEATPYLGERFRGGSELRAGLTDKAGVQMYGWGLVKATEHSLELDVPAAGVARLIGTLESTAPQQVSVTFNDVPAGSLDLLTPEAGYTIAGGEWKERGVRGDDAENARAHFGVAMARAPAETPKKTPESAAPASPSEARELPADKPVERLAGRGGGGGARRATTAARNARAGAAAEHRNSREHRARRNHPAQRQARTRQGTRGLRTSRSRSGSKGSGGARLRRTTREAAAMSAA